MMLYAKDGDLCVSHEFAKQAEKAGVSFPLSRVHCTCTHATYNIALSLSMHVRASVYFGVCVR